MSEHFIEQFKKQNKCSQCRTEVCTVGRRKYKVCYGHLLKARALWQDWKQKRDEAGLCVHCNEPLALWPDGRRKSLCSNHLLYFRERARIQWREHSAECARTGRCVNYGCKRASLAGEQRCAKHKRENRLKCLYWSRHNVDHQHAAYRKRQQILDLGLCICKEHRRLPPGQRRCDPCRERHRAHR